MRKLEHNETRIMKDCIYEIWYSAKNKTVYIYPPVKLVHLIDLRERLKYYGLPINNIVVGRLYDNYL